jgi:indole-3-glycerol phosphate synthase
MNTLDNIIAQKHRHVERCKSFYPVKLLEQSIYFPTKPLSLCHYLRRQDLSGIIAEFKRKSPSKGPINMYADVEEVSIGYMQAGASALSILTDQEFFGGTSPDLTVARKFNYCPILRKDFIVDEYQVIESKSIGADAILLIAAVLEKSEIAALAQLASSLGLEVLLEVREASELEKIVPGLHLIGVNNRDLRDLSVDVQRSLDLVDLLPTDLLRVSESGISKPETILQLKGAGYEGFLLGEAFMRQARPELACARFISQLRGLEATALAMP